MTASAEQRRRAKAFRARHQGRPLLLLPNAWDAMSARVFAAEGFEAVATTSAGLSWALGYPDGEVVPWPEVVAATQRMVRAAGVPVTADIEEGYAATPEALEAHVGEIIETGIVGLNLEDGWIGGSAPLRPIEDAAARIRAARVAADRAGVPIVINARTDLYLRNIGDAQQRFAETEARGKAYMAAGADCLYPIGLGDPETIARLIKALGAPVNIMVHAGMPGVAELEAMGVARISIAVAGTLVALSATRQLAAALKETGRFDALASDLTYPDAQKIITG